MMSIVKQTLIKALSSSVVVLCLGLGLPGWSAATNITVLISLPDKLQQQSRVQIETAFEEGEHQVDIYTLSRYQSHMRSSGLQSDPVVIAAGRESCEFAAQNMQQVPVLCVLVSFDAFTQIRLKRITAGNSQRFGAIVIDQPLERQIRIANSVFPSLKKFGVLASGQEPAFIGADVDGTTEGISAGIIDGTHNSTVTIDQYNKNRAVAPQVVHALSGQDALVAIPDKYVYSSEQLRTVLLTAYGYAKPVIGYNRSYVRAGALITTFTTPNQIFRQAAEILDSFVADSSSSPPTVYDPVYFSIADNPGIARSLGLVRHFDFREEHDYVDQDFSS